MSLRKATLFGLGWALCDTVILKGSTFVAQLILARLLGPVQFGLVGMIAIFITIGTSLIDSGLSSSLIRSQEVDSKDYNTVFFTNLGISLLVYLIIWMIAPLIAAFYSQPILIAVIRIYCLSFIVSAFTAVQMAVKIREMKFKALTLINIPGTIVGIFVGIILGASGYGVWSIVWMYLATQISQSITLWLASNWRPTFIFSLDKLKIHFHFGYKLMLSGLLNTTFENIYNVIIGRFYNVRILGYYERAYLFNQYPVTTLTSIITKVTYPMLSAIQNEKQKIAFVYRNILQLTFFISAPLMLGAAAIAKPLFAIVLGKEWLPAVPFFQILCFSSILYPIHAFNLNILKVFGRSDLFLKLEVFKKVIIGIAVWISFYFGIYALIWSSVVTSFVALIINTYYTSPMINYSVKEQIRDMFLPLTLASLTALAMLFAVKIFPDNSLLLQCLLSIVIGVIFYFLLNFFFKTTFFQNVQLLFINPKL